MHCLLALHHLEYYNHSYVHNINFNATCYITNYYEIMRIVHLLSSKWSKFVPCTLNNEILLHS